MPRLARTILASGVLLVTMAPSADASTATYSGGVLTVAGAGSENNDVTVELAQLGGQVPAVVVRDSGVQTMVPSLECLPIAKNALACPGARPAQVRAVLGAGNDVMRQSPDVDDVPRELDGGPGEDVLHGSTSQDRFRPGSGADAMLGTGGDDVLDLRDQTGTVIADWAAGTATHAGSTDLHTGIDRIESGAGNDDISGFPAAFGGDGDDTLQAGPDGSLLDGGLGSDHVLGADGADRLFCGLGFDFVKAGGEDHVEDCEVFLG